MNPERHEMRTLLVVCGTVLLVVGVIAGVAVYSRAQHAEEKRRQAEVDVIRRTAPRPESPHERNVDRYLERFDRLVPGRQAAP